MPSGELWGCFTGVSDRFQGFSGEIKRGFEVAQGVSEDFRRFNRPSSVLRGV